MRLPQSGRTVEGVRADARACLTAWGRGIAAAAAGLTRCGRTSLMMCASENGEGKLAGEVDTAVHALLEVFFSLSKK